MDRRPPQELLTHRTFESLLPPIDEAAYEELLASVKDEGVRDAIVCWDGVVVEGHTRRRAAIEAGLEDVPVDNREFPDSAAAVAWALRHNLGRRHMTPQALSEIRGRLVEVRRQQAVESAIAKAQDVQDEGVTEEAPETAADAVQQVAQETGASERTVQRDAAYVRALDNLRPNLQEMARTGSISRSAAIALSRYDFDAQAAIMQISAENGVRVARACDIYDAQSLGQRLLPRQMSPDAATESEEEAPDTNAPAAAMLRMQEQDRALRAWCLQLDALVQSLPDNPWLASMEEWRVGIESLKRTLGNTVRLALGHKLCPHCAGAGCEPCRGAGYMPKTIFDMQR